MASKPLPYGLQTVTPYLIVKNAQALLDFVTKVFDAKQRELFQDPDGRIGHAEVTLGDSVIMLSDKPPHLDAMPASLYVYGTIRTPDTNAPSAPEPSRSWSQPISFYGDRNAGVIDPTGNLWWIATHVEDVSPEELARRAKAKMERRDSGAK